VQRNFTPSQVTLNGNTEARLRSQVHFEGAGYFAVDEIKAAQALDFGLQIACIFISKI